MNGPTLFGKYATLKIVTDGSNYLGSWGEVIIDLALPGIRVMDGCCCGGILKLEMELSECMQAKENKERVAAKAEEAPTTTKLPVSKIGE